jgi:arylamine N-acetyltransferase
MDNVILNPDHHAYAVRRFLEHFNIQSAPPDGELLTRVLRSFAEIPYENISKIVKLNRYFLTPERLRLPEEVMEDFRCFHLGGTCFSLSFFLHAVLQHLGYINHIVMADMSHRPNVHCALIAVLHKQLVLIDPGYLLNQPMPIHPDHPRIYRAPHRGVELKFNTDTGRYELFTFDRQMIKFRYAFFAQPTPLPEFLQHWLNSFYQGTMHGICLTQMREDHMIYLHNDFLQVTGVDGSNKKHIKADYEQVVSDLFGMPPEWIEKAQEALTANKELERKHGFFIDKRRES